MNGFLIIILLMKLVHLIKLLVMIMVWDVLLRLNVEIVCPGRDVGLKKELKYTGLNSSILLEDR